MRRISLLGMTTLVVIGLAAAASAHKPPGETRFAFQWPDGAIPQMDGDLSEWDIVPPQYEITNPDLFQVHAVGKLGLDTPRGGVDAADMFIRHRIGWNDNTNRLYFATSVFDDEHDRNHTDNCMWDDDDWEVRVAPNIPQEEQNSGNTAGAIIDSPIFLIAVPPFEGAPIGITGYLDYQPWQSAADFLAEGNTEIWEFGWDFEGEPLGESTYFYELSYRWIESGPPGDVPNFDDLTLVDLQEGDILHINIMNMDQDPVLAEAGLKDNGDSKYSGAWSISPGPDNWPEVDFVMAELENVDFMTAIEDKTWGAIKAGM